MVALLFLLLLSCDIFSSHKCTSLVIFEQVICPHILNFFYNVKFTSKNLWWMQLVDAREVLSYTPLFLDKSFVDIQVNPRGFKIQNA